ncbi:similar to Transposase [Crocosphaera watsonii WH 0401]|uniref:Similar to Transposase n=2 Tax=Crocosphaera TaxID=263510 RepID=T2JDT0_CROWT|nr:similar to Transposase [Crocosphaera watsonii WH 0401]
MKLVLKGAKVSRTEMILDNFEVIRSRPHGHVMVILETI